MKHSDPDVLEPNDVSAALLRVGVNASDQQAALIVGHSSAVLRANTRMNLTRLTDKSAVLELHIADSATALRALSDLPPGEIVDIGSGAGYPGFIVQILTGRRVTLVESVQKKATFLEETARALHLPIQVVADRAEHLASSHAERYICAVARAVSSLPALVELASPLLALGGRLVAMKGSMDMDELRRGANAARLCGMSGVSLDEFELPQGEKRSIAVFTKLRAAQVSLPRRSGLAQRHPLG